MTAAHDPAAIDARALADYLADAGVLPPNSLLEWKLLSGGRSNLTYLIDAAGQPLVLRRPPLGHTDARTHDIGREYRILERLHPVGVPVPEALAICEDERVIGARFYVMRRVAGRVIESSSGARDLVNEGRLDELVDAVVDGLVALHRVDHQAVGLAELGKPAGFAARQVRRWTTHWATRKQRAIPALDEVGRLLEAAVGTGLPLDAEPATIVHGDYNIGNLMISGSGPARLCAILDWEMATIGHPLMDLGLLLTYNGPHMNHIFEVEDSIACQPGFPGPQDIATRYAQRSGRSIDLIDFFYGLAFFKVLVLIEEVRSRHQSGTTRGEGYSSLGQSTVRNAESLLLELRRSPVFHSIR